MTLVFLCEGSSMHTGGFVGGERLHQGSKAADYHFECVGSRRAFEKENVARRFACAHVRIFEDLIVCVCVCARTFPVGPPPSIFPLSQCWNLRRPIKARLPSCDFSVSRLSLH